MSHNATNGPVGLKMVQFWLGQVQTKADEERAKEEALYLSLKVKTSLSVQTFLGDKSG